MRNRALLGILAMVVLSAGSASAGKWGPFGHSTSFSGITVCSVRLLKGQDTVNVYRDSLINGNVQVSARVRAKAGTLQYSLDSGEWQSAVPLRPGLYLFRFPAEVGKSYRVGLRVMSKSGPVGEVFGTVNVLDVSIRDQVRVLIDKLVMAYCMKDRHAFLNLTSDDFFPDISVLEDALREEMRVTDGADIKTNIVNCVAGADGKVFVTFSFRAFYTSLQKNKNERLNGTTQMILTFERGGLRLYAMRAPLLFGVTHEKELAVTAP